MQGVELRGVVALDEEADHDAFMEAFLDWLDEHGWEYEGTSRPVEVSDDDVVT
jgi:hypothetical protein